MRAIIKAALAIDELEFSLECISTDDKKEIDDYTDAEILSEAKYVLGKFTGESCGFEQEQDFLGENGPEQKKWARGEVRKLNALIKKFS